MFNDFLLGTLHFIKTLSKQKIKTFFLSTLHIKRQVDTMINVEILKMLRIW